MLDKTVLLLLKEIDKLLIVFSDSRNKPATTDYVNAHVAHLTVSRLLAQNDNSAFKKMYPIMQMKFNTIYKTRGGEIIGPFLSKDEAFWYLPGEDIRHWNDAGVGPTPPHDVVERVVEGEGWIAHNGLSIPDLKVDVEVRVFCSNKGYTQFVNVKSHKGWIWDHTETDILAYRILEKSVSREPDEPEVEVFYSPKGEVFRVGDLVTKIGGTFTADGEFVGVVSYAGVTRVVVVIPGKTGHEMRLIPWNMVEKRSVK